MPTALFGVIDAADQFINMWERLLVHAGKYPLEYIVDGVILLPVVIGFIHWKWEGWSIRLVVVYFLIAFIKVTITLWYAINGWYNIYIYNAFLIIDTLLLGGVYILAAYYPRQKIWLGALVLLGCIIIGLTSQLHAKSTEFSTVGNAVYRLTLIILVLYTFFGWLVQLRVRNLLIYPLFWISSGLLLYTTGTFFIYLFSFYALATETPSARFTFYWDTNLVFYIIFCLLATIGFWVSKYSRT